MKLIIDISKYQWNLTDAQWDILGKILDGVIIRMSFGRTIDSMTAEHIRQCKRVELPYIGYSWIDPISDFQGQLNTIIAVVQKFGPTAMMLDMEQYWQDWVAYMEQDYAKAYASRFTPEQLNSYYKKFFIAAKQYVGVTIGCYSSNSFMEDYCPVMFDWVPFNNYWRAGYPINNNHYEPIEIRTLAGTIDLSGCIGRQFSDGLDVTGLPSKLDWNVFGEDGFCIIFGENAMGKNIEFDPFISQLGYGADEHHNDCGPACCCNIIYKTKNIVISPDNIYDIPGWGAPTTDIGTKGTQLSLLLNDFGVTNFHNGNISIDEIKKSIDANIPIITLIKYGPFSAAGLTYYPGTFNHWLIVTGYTDTEIIMLDPYRPYEAGGIMKAPYALFMEAYLGVYLLCKIDGGTEVIMTNAICNNKLGVNIRDSLPISSLQLGKDIGDITYLQRIMLKEPIVDHLCKDNLIWVELLEPMVGWVAKKFFIIDTPVTPPPVIPPTIDEKTIRLDEISKAEAAIKQHFTYRRNEVNSL